MGKASAKRIEWIDIIKGICILFVMLSHSNPPAVYRHFFTPFFLTMFFFVSGYTFSTKNSFKEFLTCKIKHLVIPLFALGSIRIIGMSILGLADPLQGFKGLLLQISCQNDEMWFVSCLFTASMILYALLRFNGKYQNHHKEFLLISEAILFIIIGYSLMLVFHVRLIWEFEIACIMLLYMVLGYLFKRTNQVSLSKLLSPVLFLIYASIVFLLPNDVDIHAEVFTNPLLFNVNTLLIILPVIDLAKKLDKTVLRKPLIFLGQNSLFFFAFSGIVRETFVKILHVFIVLNPYIESILCTVVMTIVLILPASFTRKYIPWIVGASK